MEAIGEIRQPAASRAATLCRAGVFTLAVFFGFITGFLSQASSPDYHQLFWSILPIAISQPFLAIGYFLCSRHWTRWIVVGITLVALAFFSEMNSRVWR